MNKPKNTRRWINLGRLGSFGYVRHISRRVGPQVPTGKTLCIGQSAIAEFVFYDGDPLAMGKSVADASEAFHVLLGRSPKLKLILAGAGIILGPIVTRAEWLAVKNVEARIGGPMRVLLVFRPNADGSLDQTYIPTMDLE